MRDLESTGAAGAQHLARDEQDFGYDGECDEQLERIMGDYIQLEHLRKRGYGAPIQPNDFSPTGEVDHCF